MNWLLDAKIHVLNADILWREIIGNLIGLASAVGGMRRKVWAWPIGMIANVMLITVFLGAIFSTPQAKDLWGQAGRQVFFFLAAAYGWWQWNKTKHRLESQVAVVPRWASWRERAALAAIAILGVVVGSIILRAIGSYGPWADAWIFMGSLLATIGMAKGYVEFWLIWIAVDLVGVPLLFQAGYYPSALLYAVYGIFCIWGFTTWYRLRDEAPTPTDPSVEALA